MGSSSLSVLRVLFPAIIMRHLVSLLLTLSLVLTSVTSLPAPEADEAVTPLSVTPEVPALDTVDEVTSVSEPEPEAESEPEPEAESEPTSEEPETAKSEPEPELPAPSVSQSQRKPKSKEAGAAEPEPESESEPEPKSSPSVGSGSERHGQEATLVISSLIMVLGAALL